MESKQDERRVVLVAGGVRGLGLAAARALKERGVRVHVCWRSSAADAQDLEAEFEGCLHQADLAGEGGARSLVERVLACEGRLDGLVHSVGDYAVGPIADLTPDQLRALFDSNVMTAWNTVCAARSALREARGSIVFFGTAGLEGLRAKRETAGYAAAKSALVVLARAMAQEEAPHGVRVNVVSPGIVPHADAHGSTLDPAVWAKLPRKEPTPIDDVARTVAWLILDAPPDLSGADVALAGGWML